jgi:acyl carrier protein
MGMRQVIHDGLTEVFRDVFDDEGIVVERELTASQVAGWDSLTHIRLMLSVERKFRVKFTVTEIGELKNVGELIDLIEKKSPRGK